jgi:hypothetical protein
MAFTSIQHIIVKRLVLLLSITVLFIGLLMLQAFGLVESRYGAAFVTAFLLVFLLAPFVQVPIHLHRNHWLSVQTEYEPISPARDVIPEEAWLRIRKGVASLSPCGFQVLGHFQKSAQVSGAMGYVTLLKNANLITVARLVTVFGTALKGRPAKGSLVFTTELADGTKLVTSNSTTTGLTPRRKNRLRLWMPEIQDPLELYEFHERLVQRFGKQPKLFDLNGDFNDYLRRHSDDQRAHWIKEGYYRLDSAAQLYRPTWKGAVLLAWKQLWPLKPLSRAWRKHQTNKLLRKLEE